MAYRKKGSRIFNMYNGRGTIIDITHRAKKTFFGVRATYRVKFDDGLEMDMNTAQLMSLPKHDNKPENKSA